MIAEQELRIAKDRDNVRDDNYYVYDYQHLGAVIYKGKYWQCLCVVGGLSLDPDTTIEEIRIKTQGFV